MIKPLFMWAGGKTKLLKHYIPYMPDKVDTYYEPFFGGGAMFLYIMEHYKPSKVYINDINIDIMRIYRVIGSESVYEFIDIVDALQKHYMPLNKELRKSFYFKLRHEHAYDYVSWTDVKQAATLYFLMKTGFNGIFQINKNTNGRFGTPSGLLNQTDRVYDRDNVIAWANILRQADVDISYGDWKDLTYTDTDNTFIFFDPPYRGSFTSYGQSFNDIDQNQLLKQAKSFKYANVFLSNRDINDNFWNNVESLKKIEIDVTYTAGRRKKTDTGYEAKKAKEILLYTERNK
jgi:DNA adenine methylase